MSDTPAQPLFIFGCPRSGTTFLGELLNHHSRILITNELRMMSFYADMLAAAVKARHQIHNQDLRLEFVAHMQSRVADTVESYYHALAQRKVKDVLVWGDKTPGYADPILSPGCLEFILSVFPRARFIHIRRDPLEVVRSIVGKRWMGLDAAVDMWARITRRGRELGASLPADQYLEITHEDLSANGPAVTAQILTFLNVTSESRIEEFLREESKERTPYSDPIALPGATAAFNLSPEQTARVHALLGHNLADVERTLAAYAANKTTAKAASTETTSAIAGELQPVPESSLLGELEVRITGLALSINDQPVASNAPVRAGDKVAVTVRAAALRPFDAVILGVTASDEHGNAVMGGNNAHSGLKVFALPVGLSTLLLVFNWPDLGNGLYRLTIGIGEGSDSESNLVQCWADKFLAVNQQPPERKPSELVRCVVLEARRE